jgi:hypothetical protein
MDHYLLDVSDKIPEEARQPFSVLSGEVSWLREKWLNYQYLFGHSQERIDLLNQAGSSLFAMIHDNFIDDFILEFFRLIDPGKGKQKNLSLESLIVVLDPTKHAKIIKDLRLKLKSIRAKSEGIVKHRHKRVAHRDKLVALSTTDVLPPVSRALIDDLLIEVEEFLTAFNLHFSGVRLAFNELKIFKGADRLRDRLLKARAYDSFEKQGFIPKGSWRSFAEGANPH